MKRRLNVLIFILILIFMNVLFVQAAIQNPGTTGITGNLGSLGDGAWNTSKVGIKVSIVSSGGTLKDVEIILNKTCSSCYFSNNNYPKIMQSSSITWKKHNYQNVESRMLGSKWTYNKNGSTYYYSLSNIMEKSNYANLKSILSKYFSDVTFSNDDYILVEPMADIGGYWGTAYELGNAFLTLNSTCNSKGKFCWMYKGAVFGGSNSKKEGGLFWKTIYYEGSKLTFGSYSLSKFSGTTINNDRHNCLKSSTCSRGIGVYKYGDLYPPQYYLDLNGYLDGTKANNISGYGTADIYINGTRVANDVSDYYKKWPSGTTYEIKDIKAASGKKYNGVYSGSVSGTLTSDKRVYLNFSSLGGLKIVKTNSSNDVLAQLTSSTTAKFKLYNNSSCTGTALKDFSAGHTISNLDPGTYYLKEYQTKKGYHLPQSGEKWYCEKITVTAAKTKEIKVENKTECEYKFNASMTMKERIDLYNLIKTNYAQEFNALLDMSNTTAETACKNIPVAKTYTKNCLSSESYSDNSNNFSETNVSMYTEKYGKYTFCLTKYKMVNSLGKTKFNNIKTGQVIIKTDNVVATATLNRVCHNFGDTNITSEEYNNLKYSNYIKEDASIDGTKLIKNEVESGTINNKTITATYTLPVMYASNKDGKVYYGSCPSGEYCKVLGKGTISKFNLKPGTYSLKFDISLNEEKLGNRGPTSDCSYTVENELIDYNNKLSIEFRAVNTDSDALFLSKDGTSDRKIGANWSSEEDREFVLKVKNNSYNKNKEEPLYKITLTPEITKEIRKNNKTKAYDDYNMTCVEDGTICISNYLTCLQNRGILQIKDRKNIDKFKLNQRVCIY